VDCVVQGITFLTENVRDVSEKWRELSYLCFLQIVFMLDPDFILAKSYLLALSSNAKDFLS